jgi:hypothetical protein
MKCLFSAAMITLEPQNFESKELLNQLRDAIFDALISITHGMSPLAVTGSEIERRLQDYALKIFQYIDELLKCQDLDTNEEFVKNLYELYSDLTE